jgi:hypothetical protein
MTKTLSIIFSELTRDGNGHPRENKIFSRTAGEITSVTCLREDNRWQIALRRVHRRKKRIFTCSIEEIEEIKIRELNGKRVIIYPDLIIF